MGCLVIDEVFREKVSNLIRRAKSNFLTKEHIEKLKKGDRAPAGDSGFGIFLDVGFKVAFTIEQWTAEDIPLELRGWYRHISISLNDELPPRSTVEFLLKEFGFRQNLDGIVKNGGMFYCEKEANPDAEIDAINVMEKMEKTDES